MGNLDPAIMETLGLLFGFILTLFVFSYLLGDNPLFRLAVHIFVGVAAGYALAVAWHGVLAPRLFSPIMEALNTGDLSSLSLLIWPLALCLLLAAKLSPRFSGIGSISTAYLVGVGAAVAIGGAVAGTLFPQVNASTEALNDEGLFYGSIILLGTLSTLIYFNFGARAKADGEAQQNIILKVIGIIGQIFIAITFGVMFAGVYAAALTALIDRIQFLWQYLSTLTQG